MFEESLLAPKFPFDIDIDNLIISTKLFMKKQNKKSVHNWANSGIYLPKYPPRALAMYIIITSRIPTLYLPTMINHLHK
jgi:hypothetical protein